jgi:hypothetical protein
VTTPRRSSKSACKVAQGSAGKAPASCTHQTSPRSSPHAQGCRVRGAQEELRRGDLDISRHSPARSPPAAAARSPALARVPHESSGGGLSLSPGGRTAPPPPPPRSVSLSLEQERSPQSMGSSGQAQDTPHEHRAWGETGSGGHQGSRNLSSAPAAREEGGDDGRAQARESSRLSLRDLLLSGRQDGERDGVHGGAPMTAGPSGSAGLSSDSMDGGGAGSDGDTCPGRVAWSY